MRPSNRSTILSAAIRVIERDGITAVTFDSVAAESGLTRGGILYHFPSREALLTAIHQYLADQWEDGLIAAAGKSAEDTTADERLAAYVRVSAHSATRAELRLMLEAAVDADTMAPWNAVLQHWTPTPSADIHDPDALSRFIVRLAADGLWMYEALSNQPLDPQLRQLVADQIVQIWESSSATSPSTDH